MKYSNILLLALCAILCPVLAERAVGQDNSGSIRGKIEIPPVAVSQNRHNVARYGNLASDDAEMKPEQPLPPEVTNVVVYLEGRGIERIRRESRKAVLDQRNATFIPHVLPIARGTTVEIVNQDKTYHNVFSLSSVKKFNIGRRPTGEAVPVVFDKAGIVQVFCDIHSHMNAYIVVLDTDIFTQPKADGTFMLNDLPAGDYTLHVWHERFAAPPVTVSVKAGEPTTADFSMQ